MKTEKRSKNKLTSWEEVLDENYGKEGTIERTELEISCQTIIIEELLKEEKSKPNLMDLKLAETKLAEARLILADLMEKKESGTGTVVISNIPIKQKSLISKTTHKKSA